MSSDQKNYQAKWYLIKPGLKSLYFGIESYYIDQYFIFFKSVVQNLLSLYVIYSFFLISLENSWPFQYSKYKVKLFFEYFTYFK